ncbi:biotin/lipoyl-containing protein [Xylanibacter oryzae]|uniref:biotin/lipoyl-containing protein n=1 Tax=Xylanibacter oryzae TaxID=185293 RepID=UPI0004B34625|nr:biotin/lipoyl-containing protein [Xylanibacter oryzae]
MSKYQYKVQGVDYDVDIQDIEGNIAKVSVNGIPFEVELKQAIHNTPKPQHVHVEPHKPAAVSAQPEEDKPIVIVPTGSGTPVSSPLPGTITEVKVKVGDTVKEGDVVIVLEAMKMQNNIEAETSGTITSISVNNGDTVMEGAALLTIG